MLRLQVLLTEASHTFGLCLLTYRILPQFDVVRALLLMCATCQVPALLKLLLTKGQRSVLTIIVDILAVLMQASLFFLMTRYSTRDRTVLTTAVDLLQIAAAVLLISLRYWENFVDRDIGAISITSFKINLRLGRCKTYIFASLWKIGLTLAFAYILVPNMTPMGELLNHVGNETAYDNKSVKVDNIDVPAYYLPPPNEANNDGNPLFRDAAYDDNFNIEDDGRIAPRFRRQADDEDEDSIKPDNEETILDDDPIDEGPRRRRPVRRRKPPKPKIRIEDYNYDYDYGAASSGGDYQTFKKENKVLFRFLPFIVQSLSGAICYYFARVACKLCMQGFSFSVPMTLITPATVVIFSYLCDLEDWKRVYIPDMDIGYLRCSESYKITSFHWQVGCALALWWLSQLWITNHVWFSKSERLAKVEK